MAVVGQLHHRDDLAFVADMRAVDFAHALDGLLLVATPGAGLGQALVDEVVEAGQRLQADLAAKFVEARDASLTVANDVEGRDVDHLGRRVQVRHRQVLQEMRVVAQVQQAEALPAHAERPVFDAPAVHLLGRAASDRVHDRDPGLHLVRIIEAAVFDQVRQQRMQAVNRWELFREIER